MAYLNVNAQEINKRNVFSEGKSFDSLTVAFEGDGNDFGAVLSHCERDDKYLVLLYNEGDESETVTVKGGNALQGGKDMTFALQGGSYTLFQPDSGRFKNVSGEYKGKVVFAAASADVRIAVFRLP